MNKKTVVIATGTVVLSLGAAGCSGGSSKTYSYEVSGTVEAAQVDYECKGDPALEPVAFTVGNPKPKPKKASDSGGDKKDVAVSAPPKKTPTAKAPPKALTSKAPAKSDGVKLSKKPDRPERVAKAKAPKYKHKPKGCHEEYELFVRNGDGLFEQNVRKVDYDKCSDRARERFPSCTKN